MKLWDFKNKKIGIKPGSIISNNKAFLVSFGLLGFDILASVYVGIALAFSSTIIIMKLLSDRGQLDSLYGKISIGILIIQDIIAIVVSWYSCDLSCG